MKTGTRLAALLLALGLALNLTCPSLAAGRAEETDAIFADTAQLVYEGTQLPQGDSAGGEWAVIGLARSSFPVPEAYWQRCYETLEARVRDCGGVLHPRKYTEYSRVITALSAMGRDPREVAGYDLTRPLGDFDQTVWQGLNGPIWALIALDSQDLPMPQNPEARTQATRQMYLDYILDRQCPDGGWNLQGDGTAASDPDITGMALQALAKYQDQPSAAQAVQRALEWVSRQQDGTGGVPGWGADSVESCAQLILALCELGIPLDDPRFVKEGHTLADKLFSFRAPEGGFVHSLEHPERNAMATEQALCALAALQRAEQGLDSLYRMGGGEPDQPALSQGQLGEVWTAQLREALAWLARRFSRMQDAA